MNSCWFCGLHFLAFAAVIPGLELGGEPALDHMSLEHILAVVVRAADLTHEGPTVKQYDC